MAKLTDGPSGTIAKASAPDKGQRFIFDDHRDAPRGFGVRITAAGGRAFILKYTFEGRQRRKTLGDWPTWSLLAAREEATALRRKVDSGIDPIDEKRRQRAEPTVAEVVEQFCCQHADQLRTGREVRRYLGADFVPEFGNQKVTTITRRDIRALIEAKQGNSPVAARNLLAHVRKCLNWALERDIIEANPCAGIKVAPARRRARVLDEEEIRAFWVGLEDADIRPLMRFALRLLLLTGQRPGEVIAMRWDELRGNVWTILEHKHKTADGQSVPLAPMAVELVEQTRDEQLRLAKRRRERVPDALFTTGGSPYTVNAMSRAASRNAACLGNKYHPTWGHWTPHDLRRTVRTGLSALKVPEHIAERVIGHRPQGVVAVYDQHRYDPEKRAALEAWEQRLRGILAMDDRLPRETSPSQSQA